MRKYNKAEALNLMERLEEVDITGRHILLLEDNELNMEIAEMLLQDAGEELWNE